MTNLLVDRIAEHGEDFHSDSVDIVGYDKASKTLYVEFHSGGDVYSYEGVEESTYNLLVTAPSVGRFVANHIKDNGYRGNKFDGGECIVLREEDEGDLSPQGDKRWLTNPGGDRPIFGGEEVNGLLDSLIVNAPLRYAVEYVVTHGTGGGGSQTFRPEFIALSEADALCQFEEAVKSLETVLGWTNLDIKVRSVTHYLD